MFDRLSPVTKLKRYSVSKISQFSKPNPFQFIFCLIENMEYISQNCRAIEKQRGFDPAVYKYLPNLVANQKPSPVPTTVKWLYNIEFTIS